MPQHILIIDDSPAIHALLQARLKDEPVVLHFAGGGDEGLLKAQSILPDLILLDVDMPAPDGFEVCRRLKVHESLHGIPVIFMIGAGATEEKLRGLELGAMDYIAKPFDAAEVRARVRAALRMKFMIDLLAKKAQIDALTGLWNRRYFDQRLDAEISLSNRAQRPLAVALIELDNFKPINDQFGHPAGDEVLRQVGHALVESVRGEDVVCRFAGESFAIIAPNLGAGTAALGERLCVRIAATESPFAGRQLKLTASIGVAYSTAQVGPGLVRSAEEALQRAKQSGRNRVEVAPPDESPRLQKPAA